MWHPWSPRKNLKLAPEKLHVETSLTGSWPEDFPGVGNRSGVCHVLLTLLWHLDQAELLGTCWAGHLRRKQLGLGNGCFGVPLEGRIFFLPFLQRETGLRRGRTTQRGRSGGVPRVLARIRTGGPSYQAAYWRAVLATACQYVEGCRTLIQPLCAEEEVPTAANLNLYRGGTRELVGTAMMSRCLESVVRPNSLCRCVLAALQSSNGRVSPVRTMKPTFAAFSMVTSLSWMANVRTSFFIVRILVWNRNGLTLRSVGSNNMFPPVPF